MKPIKTIINNRFYLNNRLDTSIITQYKWFTIRPVVRFNKWYSCPYIEYDICDPSNNRIVYRSKFWSIKSCAKFIDLHFSDLLLWKTI